MLVVERIKENYKLHKEVVLYIFFGGMTTLVNFFTYFIFRSFMIVKFSSCLSWLCAVLFAYATNKYFVFESRRKSVSSLINEFSLFIISRLFSGIIEIGSLTLLVNEETPKITEAATKMGVTIIVVIINYMLSKMIVFTKKAT